MLKRRNSTKEEDSYSNKVQIISKNEKEEPQLPIELIIKIISYLNDIKDLRNCMLLSKTIRQSIYEFSVIMRKIELEFCIDTDFVDEIDYLKLYGQYIQCLKLDYPYNSQKLMKFILSLVPNLNSLEFKNSSALTGLDETVFEPLKLDEVDPPKLQNLRNLNLDVVDYEEFFEIFKNVKNLHKIIYSLSADNIEDEFLDFLVQQDDLKELTMWAFLENSASPYEHRDISQEVKFQLRSLRCFSNCENFQKILKSQAEHLQEFRHRNPNDEVLRILLGNCRNLREILLDDTYKFNINWNDYIGYKLETVKFLEHYSTIRVNLASVYEIFPNLESLKSYQISDAPGSFDKLRSLNVETLYLNCIKNTKFPGLKSLTVKYLHDIYDEKCSYKNDHIFSEANLLKFIQNASNLENLSVNLMQDDENTKCLFKHLRKFQNLQFAEINFKFIRQEEEHKIFINFAEKTVTSKRVIHDVVDLKLNFGDFVFLCTDEKLLEDTMNEEEVDELKPDVESEASKSSSESSSSDTSDSE